MIGWVLVLRTCDANMQGYGGFQWPESGPVEAPDWKPTPECGHGLHGWLWGAGDWSLKNADPSPRWLVVRVEASEIIELTGKVKFPRGIVEAAFDNWADAMALIRRDSGCPKAESSATGSYGHASATGYSGHASATGSYGHASATGHSGHASATGYSGHASATGSYGHASATGHYGHASATGHSGHASATGSYGHASATGYSGWAIAGYNGTGRAAANGVLTVLYWDGAAGRPRVAVGYVGEDGIEPNVDYCVRDGRLAKASS